MALEYLNPIASVDGVSIPAPSTYKYGLQDISESDAGRTEDTVMDKQRIGQCVKIELAWQNVSIEDGAKILQAFQPEYIEVKYLDGLQGKFLTSEFYVGDRSSTLYYTKFGKWSKISFNIIERDGRKAGVSDDY